MTFEFNPADEDPHGECRHEIQRLEAENERLRVEMVDSTFLSVEEVEELYRLRSLIERLRGVQRRDYGSFGVGLEGMARDPNGRFYYVEDIAAILQELDQCPTR